MAPPRSRFSRSPSNASLFNPIDEASTASMAPPLAASSTSTPLARDAPRRSSNPLSFRTILKKLKSKDNLSTQADDDHLDFGCAGQLVEDDEEDIQAEIEAEIMRSRPAHRPQIPPVPAEPLEMRTQQQRLLEARRPSLPGTSSELEHLKRIAHAHARITAAAAAANATLAKMSKTQEAPSSNSSSLAYYDSSSTSPSSTRSSATFSTTSSVLDPGTPFSSSSSASLDNQDAAGIPENETEEEGIARRAKEEQAAIEALDAYFAWRRQSATQDTTPELTEDETEHVVSHSRGTSSATERQPEARRALDRVPAMPALPASVQPLSLQSTASAPSLRTRRSEATLHSAVNAQTTKGTYGRLRSSTANARPTFITGNSAAASSSSARTSSRNILEKNALPSVPPSPTHSISSSVYSDAALPDSPSHRQTNFSRPLSGSGPRSRSSTTSSLVQAAQGRYDYI